MAPSSYGEKRGDELSEQLRTPEGRRQALADAKRRGGRRGGRREWPRVARRELEARRQRQAQPIPRDREDRLFQALDRLQENHRVDLAANQAYDRWRATPRDTLGRVLKGNSKPFTALELPEGVINLSDLDSGVMRTQGTPPRQADNAQARSTTGRSSWRRRSASPPRTSGTWDRCSRALFGSSASRGVTETPDVVLADAGYWHTAQRAQIAEQRIEVLAPPDGNMREGTRPGWEHVRYQQMREKLSSDRGRELYAQRKITIERTSLIPHIPTASRHSDRQGLDSSRDGHASTQGDADHPVRRVGSARILPGATAPRRQRRLRPRQPARSHSSAVGAQAD